MMHAAWAVVAGGLLLQAGGFDELRELRRSARRKKAEAAALVVLAHEALDRADYDRAVGQRRKARALEDEVAGLKAREERLIPGIVAALVRDLMDDDVAVRERATSRLVAVGSGAVRPLEAVAASGDAETRGRAQAVLRRLSESGVDAEGRLRQWASKARASSEYQPDSWSAMQATGRPNTPQGGDAVTAWASLAADSDEEWLELSYDQAVKPCLVRIHETFNPGAVAKIEARDAAGRWQVLWQALHPARPTPGWLEVRVDAPFATRELRITIDNDAVPGWNEIDAVELAGEAGD
jgi:hypothetical protein